MLKLISFAKKNITEISDQLELDKNRKKSHNMILASLTVEEILSHLLPDLKASPLDVLFCSGEGEIQQTFEYYKNLAQNRARPILFQNSLHNSTLGSLSLEIPNIASGITISNGDISFEAALDIALSSPSFHPVLILGVDAYNAEIQNLRAQSYGEQVELISGASGALFLPSTHPLYSQVPGPIIKDIRFSTTSEQAHFSDYYPANGLEAIYEHLIKGEKSFSLIRPHGHQVTIISHEI